MKKYEIEIEVFLGMSHCGGEYADGVATVELSDEEVAQLVDLIRKTESTDVYDMELDTVNPELFGKLDDACCEAAQCACELHWHDAAYAEGLYDFDDVLENAESELGFKFEYKEEDYLDKDGKFDEDLMQDDRREAFSEFLDKLVQSLDDDERMDFYINKLNMGGESVDMEHYDVLIPQEIIDMAEAK